MTARLDVLCAGYAAERVASTVVLIRDEGAVIVVDPARTYGGRRRDRTPTRWPRIRASWSGPGPSCWPPGRR